MRRLVRDAWREWREAYAYSHGLQYPEVNPPGWFYREELGFGLNCGPSILAEQHRVEEGKRALALIERKYGHGARRAGKLH